MDQVPTRHKPAAEAIAELIAVLVAVTDGEPRVLTIDRARALPSGPFEPTHRSLQAGMRSWVEQQTHHPLGYVEQLYTFADRDLTAMGQRTVSVSYLGLTREVRASGEPGVGWQSWYRYFPWEDRRGPDTEGVAADIDARPSCADVRLSHQAMPGLASQRSRKGAAIAAEAGRASSTTNAAASVIETAPAIRR